eukprot:CAMPEP_0171894298 /NCGR_PEP_ID=MMETSP0992-20121227/46391_1 /TAXON_ID=483369 /ORGANISM="non described non described, Strain CCMP2098" /LENGTH=335 /DNA_ID=CAMNT_0012522077 /DNA_START=68 /DNA_END=1077 /DNA_ORIENTATION=-
MPNLPQPPTSREKKQNEEHISTETPVLKKLSEEPDPIFHALEFIVDVKLDCGSKVSSELEKKIQGAGGRTLYRSKGSVTHIVFMKGDAQRAQKMRESGVSVVVPSWVEAARTLLPTDEYQAELSEARVARSKTYEPDVRNHLQPSDPWFSSSQRDSEQYGESLVRGPKKRARSCTGERSDILGKERSIVTLGLSGFDHDDKTTMLRIIEAIRKRVISGMALDGALGSEKECRVSGREWDPREERQSCLEGKTVYLDPDLLDPPAATMRKLIILAGGAVSSRRDTATLHIASSKVKFGPSRVLGEDATTQITMSPAQLFDAIEAALSPTQRPSTDR